MATIKVTYNSSVRRFTIPTSTTWFEFERTIRSLFSIKESTPVIVAYKDEDDDIITISSDLELGEILSNSSGQSLTFTVSTNGDDSKNSWIFEGNSTEPYRIAEGNDVTVEESLSDQNQEVTKEPTVETQPNYKSTTFHLHTTVTDETDEPQFEPTVVSDKKGETHDQNEPSDASSRSQAARENSKAEINSSNSTSNESKNIQTGTEVAEDTENLWEELLKTFLVNDDTTRRETPQENPQGLSLNARPHVFIRVSPTHFRQTYVPRASGFRCGRSFTRSPFAQTTCPIRTAFQNDAQNCDCHSTRYGWTTNVPHNNYCDPEFRSLSKFIFRILFIAFFFSALITMAKVAFFVLSLLLQIASVIIPIVFLIKLHKRFYVRRVHSGFWNHEPFFRMRNPSNVQFLRRRHGFLF